MGMSKIITDYDKIIVIKEVPNRCLWPLTYYIYKPYADNWCFFLIKTFTIHSITMVIFLGFPEMTSKSKTIVIRSTSTAHLHNPMNTEVDIILGERS